MYMYRFDEASDTYILQEDLEARNRRDEEDLPVPDEVLRTVALSAMKWQIYIDLEGMTRDEIERHIFSIPKVCHDDDD